MAVCGQEACSELPTIQQLLLDQENEAVESLINPCLEQVDQGDVPPGRQGEIWRTATWWAVQSGHHEEALGFGKRAVVLLPLLEDPAEKARILQELGNAYFFQNQYYRAEDSFRYARGFAEKSGDEELYRTVTKDLGVALGSRGAFAEAIGILRLVDDKSEKAKTSALAVSVLGNLSGYYRRLGFRELAYDSLLEALEVAQNRQVDHEIADIMLRIGHLWWGAGEVKQARDAFEEALEHSHHSNFGSLSWLLSSARDAELELGRYPEALAYGREALEYSSAIGNRKQMVYDLFGMADVLLESGDRSGESYLGQIEALGSSLDSWDRIWLHKLQGDAERLKGDTDSEITHLRSAMTGLRRAFAHWSERDEPSGWERAAYDPIFRRNVEALTRRSNPGDWEEAFSVVSEGRDFARGGERRQFGNPTGDTLGPVDDPDYRRLWNRRQSLRREMEGPETLPLDRFQELVDLELEIAAGEKTMAVGSSHGFEFRSLAGEKLHARLDSKTVLP